MTKEERIAKMNQRQNFEGGTTRKVAYKLPESVQQYKMKEGENRIDIIPYRITNPMNPAVKFNGFKVGDLDYFQQLDIHKQIGTNYNQYLCVRRMFGDRCAICDAQRQAYDAGDAETGKSLYPTTYAMYAVRDLDEPEKGIQVLFVPYNWFEKPLRELAAMKSKKGPPIIFGDWEIGKTIVFYGMKKTFGKGEFIEPGNFNFEEREEQYTEDIAKTAPALDQFYVIPTYDEVEADYLQAPLSSKDEEEEEYDNYEEEEEVVEPVSAKKETAGPEDFEDDDLPAEPVKRRERRRTEEAGFVCPYGHKAGHEFDTHEDCNKCQDKDYNECGDLYDKLNK